MSPWQTLREEIRVAGRRSPWAGHDAGPDEMASPRVRPTVRGVLTALVGGFTLVALAAWGIDGARFP
jgi:hypothetical protein